MTEHAEYWYTVQLTGANDAPRTIDVLATSKLQAEVQVIKIAETDWPTGSPWRCVKSSRTRG